MHFGDEIAHLNLLAVDSQFQRRGLGRQLLAWLEESAMTAGTFTVCLEVRARNPVALLFYRRLGFTESGRVPRYYSGREDALRMTKTLRHPLAPLLEMGDYSESPANDNEPRADESGRYSVDWLTTRFKR
jgi:predicted N-acetyltransferase YhbS